MNTQLDIQTLGRFRVLRGATPIPDNSFGTHRAKTLLKVLLTHHGQVFTRDQIIDWMWQDVSLEAATRALYTAVSDLRHVLEPNLAKPADSIFILSTDEGYRFNSEAPNLTFDQHIFVQHIAAARKDASQHSLEAAAKAYSDAENLYAGDYLPDDLYADWSVAERERLRALFLGVLLESAEVQAQLGHYREAITKCRRALEMDNCLEPGYRALMLYYHSAGERPQALRVYAECQAILQRELGVEPMAETTALFQSIKESSATFIEKPISNLPIPLTSFIGRKHEMAQVKKSLTKTRLLTLTGAGGSGKTRLALQVATELIDSFKDGVWWVELAALSDESLVTRAVAKVLSVFEQSQQPLNETLQNYLRSKQLLLVLDNCEHLVHACAQLTEDLLSASPSLKILASSREALSITGEMIWRVLPLSLPDPSFSPPSERLMQYESIRLFVERAVAVNQHFVLTTQNASAVMQVCQRLDGMPLAIELAAARIKTLSPEQIAMRLDDRFNLLTDGNRVALPRHQTLRATIDWSYNLLSESERMLLRRLSTFAGGWTLEGAIAVSADGGLNGNAMLDLLTNLVDKSLVDVEHHDTESRYRLLETIREYAREKLLKSSEEQEARNRHLDFFYRLTEEVIPKLYDAEGATRLNRLDAEYNNLRAALEWAIAKSGAEVRLKLALNFAEFARTRGYFREASEWLEKALAGSDSAPAKTRAEALRISGAILTWLGNFERGAALKEESLAIYRDLGDKSGIAFILNWLGIDAWFQGDDGRARSLGEEALALQREIGDKSGLAETLENLGAIAQGEDDYLKMAEYTEEAHALHQELGNRRGVGRTLGDLAIIAQYRGEHRRAVDLLAEAFTLLLELKDKWSFVQLIEAWARSVFGSADSEQVARLLGMAEALRQTTGVPFSSIEGARPDPIITSLRAQVGEAKFAKAWAEGRAMTVEQAIEHALKSG